MSRAALAQLMAPRFSTVLLLTSAKAQPGCASAPLYVVMAHEGPGSGPLLSSVLSPLAGAMPSAECWGLFAASSSACGIDACSRLAAAATGDWCTGKRLGLVVPPLLVLASSVGRRVLRSGWLFSPLLTPFATRVGCLESHHLACGGPLARLAPPGWGRHVHVRLRRCHMLVLRCLVPRLCFWATFSLLAPSACVVCGGIASVVAPLEAGASFFFFFFFLGSLFVARTQSRASGGEKQKSSNKSKA